MNGNVGIGTWSPTQRLQVVGTVAATAFSGDGSALTGIAAGGWNDGGTNVYTSTTTDNVGIGTTTPSTTLEIVKQGTQSLLMVSATATGDGNYLIIDSAGNVGIGTVSALTSTLTVNGGIKSVSTSAGSIVLSEGSAGGVNTITIAAPSTIASDRSCTLEDDATPFDGCITAGAGGWTDGGTNVYTATTTDNVGIGTTTPASTLTLAGNMGIGTTTPYRTIAGPANGIAAGGNVGIGTWAAANGKLIVMGGNVGVGTTTPVGAFTVMNGNVGIGTWSPRARVEVNNSLSYSSIYDNGNSSTAITINWNVGNIQKVTMTGNCTFTFTAPGGIARLTLQLTQDGTGGRTATWPAAVKWPGASAPTLTATAAAVDFVSCLYDGTNYYCADSLDLR